MYKVLNWLFGWDYIQWNNFADSGVARVHLDEMGRVWYWRYKNILLADVIENPSSVLWLTCNPEKYFRKAHNVE